MRKKIAVVGPESTGKSTLVQLLAEHFGTNYVEEYGRTYCEKFGNDCDALDLCHIAAGQLYHEELGLQASTHPLLLCDTDVLITQTYAELYLGKTPDILAQWAAAQVFSLTLLMDVDVPWTNDNIRLFAERRQWHFNRIKELLEWYKRPYVVISGTYEERFERAALAITKELTHT